MIYKVKSLPIKEVIADLAEAMGGTVEDDCTYYILSIPSAVGKGTICGIDFGYGFGMLIYACSFREDVEIRFTLNEVHPIKFLYCHEGSFRHQFAATDQQITVETYQNIIVASAQYHGHVLNFKANLPIILHSVEIDRKSFINRFVCNLEHTEPRFRQLLEDVTAETLFFYTGNFSYKISEIIQQVLHFKEKYLLRAMYLEGKSYEMLVEQWLQYYDDQQDDAQRRILRRSNMASIEMATQYIDQHMGEDLSVATITRHIGMNKLTLQDGFKQRYGLTVNRYVQEARLKKARVLLESGDYNVSETLLEVGLQSKSYFSKVFKEKYGLSPSHYRKLFWGDGQEEEEL